MLIEVKERDATTQNYQKVLCNSKYIKKATLVSTYTGLMTTDCANVHAAYVIVSNTYVRTYKRTVCTQRRMVCPKTNNTLWWFWRGLRTYVSMPPGWTSLSCYRAKHSTILHKDNWWQSNHKGFTDCDFLMTKRSCLLLHACMHSH